MAKSSFIRADEVSEVLGVSRAEAYRIIKRLNGELAAKGYIVINGRVNRRYLEEQMYDVPVKKTDDEHFEIEALIAVSPQFYGWIFGLDDKVEIAGPPDAREGMKTVLNVIRKKYLSTLDNGKSHESIHTSLSH